MDKSKDPLAVFYGNSAQEDILDEARGYFVALIAGGERPAKALRNLIVKYSLKRLDHSTTFALLRAAFPSIQLMDEALSSRIIDADYPNSSVGLDDGEFDGIIERIKDGSESW